MFMDLIRQRRSIRKFTEEDIPADKIEMLKEAALRPPSSMAHRPAATGKTGQSKAARIELSGRCQAWGCCLCGPGKIGCLD